MTVTTTCSGGCALGRRARATGYFLLGVCLANIIGGPGGAAFAAGATRCRGADLMAVLWLT
ncbi:MULTISPECIES: hypothetical protein [unclassified Pseudomonas]|uniref:hypothetical protein n=1 Tax=unclassified Pseudomonas TaxID=196821 RepID=UPI0011EE4B70|nr:MULTISPECIES: hypothetical protein [unclassified Pseudomonas]KAA0943725.1 hypothetical protein FQ182_23595 [Pseudomonas sp. ANT_H4]KAA0950132.1 hypothetical protein FQ186_20890 [Pseudomonas sp. ANT_H14]